MRIQTNPFLKKGLNKSRGYSGNKVMTISGAYFKTFILLMVLLVGFIYSWINTKEISYMIEGTGSFLIVAGVSLIGAFILSILTSFIPRIAYITAPIYALSEGIVLGTISKIVDFQRPGVVLSAVLLTFALALAALLVYRSNPSMGAKIRKGVFMAVMAIFMVQLVGFGFSFFGITLPIYKSGTIGIIFSLVVIIIATLNLIVSYDTVIELSNMGAPKYMEWYSAFGIVVTLVWLYLEVVELLIKITGKDE